MDFVEKYPGVGKIGLWGRSMGAATTLIYANMDKRIKAIVVDSPFEDFRKLAKEMVLGQIKLPGFLVEGAISIIGKSVKNRNGMDINDIKAIDAVKNCDIPIIFIHAKDDELVPYHHSEDLIKNYKGKNKILKTVNGGHNGRRVNHLMEYVGDFFAKHLESGYNPEEDKRRKMFGKKISLKDAIKDKKKDKINVSSDSDEEEEEDEIRNIFDLNDIDIQNAEENNIQNNNKINIEENKINEKEKEEQNKDNNKDNNKPEEK